jgi:rhodanese-related sulfurtransferase/biotin operon repressor
MGIFAMAKPKKGRKRIARAIDAEVEIPGQRELFGTMVHDAPPPKISRGIRGALSPWRYLVLTGRILLMFSDSLPKKRLFEQFARVAKALASANRLALLEALAQSEHCVEALSQAVDMSVANTSHHLQILRDSGLVQSRKEGLKVIYRLTDDAIPTVVGSICGLAERNLAEVERIVRENFCHRDLLTPVRRDQLLQMAHSGEAMVIDVRPSGEYEAGHIPCAISIPLDTLPERLAELPKELEIVAYCRGPYCMLAFEAVEKLRQSGYQARRLEDGFPEWKAAQLPIVNNTQ